MKQRLYQFDILKGIGIILVMIGHAVPSDGLIHHWIYGFHMPLFFVCSGFFFKDKPLVVSTIKDVKGLLIPWFTFSLFLVACALFLQFASGGSALAFQPLDENCWILYYTIWFLISMFIVRLLYRLLAKCHNSIVINLAVWGGYFLAFLLRKWDINLPFFVDSSMAMLLFYHAGYCFKSSKAYEKRIPVWTCLCLLLLYTAFMIGIEPTVNVKENLYPCYLIILSLVPIYAMYQLCCRIESAFLMKCGVASLTIMGLHHPLYDVAMCPLMNRLPLPHALEIVMMVAITLCIVMIADKIINKYAPFLLGKF